MNRGELSTVGCTFVITLILNLIVWLWLFPIYIRWAVNG